MAEDRVRTVTPWVTTSVGRRGLASETRFWVLTWSMFGSLSIEKVTVRL